MTITNFCQYIFSVVFGYGRPLLTSKDLPYLHVLPEDLKIRYENAYKTLSAKIVSALRKKNINEKFIENAVIRAKDLYDKEIDVIKRGQLNDYIANKINKGRKI